MNESRIVLVTGATRGIGKEITLRLLEDGFFVIAQGSRTQSLESLDSCVPSKYSKRIDYRAVDFMKSDEVDNFIKSIKKSYKVGFYGLINNAGITIDKPIDFLKEKDFEAVMACNQKVPFQLCQMAFRLFRKSKQGNIINMTSIIGEKGNACQSIYSMSKAAMIGLTHSLAQEAKMLKGDIRVNGISPGFIQTDMTNSLPDDVKNHYRENIFLNKFGDVRDIADIASFLMSDKSKYINNTIIRVDGGIW